MSDLDLRLQQLLEALYRLDGTPVVTDFRIGRETLTALLGARSEAHRETLVVHSDGEDTHLALFICEDVRRRARACEAARDCVNLDPFCVATEGVSHFVYFTFCGGTQERPVSQIELELQAEIDKYLVLRTVLPGEGEELLERLYEGFSLAEPLEPGDRERYVVANSAGRRYARWLDRRFRRGEVVHALEDARRLYRKPLAAKLEHIARAA